MAVVHVRPRAVAALGPVEVLVVRDVLERRLGDDPARALAREAALALRDVDAERGAEARGGLALLRALGRVGQLRRMLGGVLRRRRSARAGRGRGGRSGRGASGARRLARDHRPMVIDDLDALLARALRLADARPARRPRHRRPARRRQVDAGRRWSWPRWATSAALVPMDGFHLAQPELVRLGRRDRMGAPDTFDAAGYVALLARLRAQGRRGRLRAGVPARDRGADRRRDRDPARRSR